jgi:hypothetical protein
MHSNHITYTSRLDATLEAELAVLANTYRFVLDCHAKKIAAEPDSCNDGVIVRNTEEVSHVEQRHDRSSKITEPAALQPHKSQILRSTESPLVQKECIPRD